MEKISASIGSIGDAYDNALIESANGLYKTECIHTTIFHHGPNKTIADVECATAAWSTGTTAAACTRASA
ncbi:integrase core domain-containing protein [Gordonia sp. SL306]|uniref:integrase core domain-containing protein n=1 Tax=Gordonia sp. SL306 TaxID=2995145 RepID=UPI003B633C90